MRMVCTCLCGVAVFVECGWSQQVKMNHTNKALTISDLCLWSSLSQLTHPIRLLLEYTDTSYEEKKYAMGDGNDTFLVYA